MQHMGRKARAPEHILDAAALLFWRHGYYSVGVEAICAAAGENKGSLYHHFTDKEGLGQAVISRNAARVLDLLAEGDIAAQPDQRILKYFAFVINEQIAEKKQSGRFPGCPFGRLMQELAGQPNAQRMEAELRRWFRGITAFLAREFRRMPRGARLSRRRLRALAEELLTLWQGSLAMARIENQRRPLFRALRRTRELLRWLQSRA